MTYGTILNAHITFHEFMKHVRAMPGEGGGAHIFFVDDIAYQKAAIQEMERAMLPVVPMKPIGDRRARLQVISLRTCVEALRRVAFVVTFAASA